MMLLKKGNKKAPVFNQYIKAFGQRGVNRKVRACEGEGKQVTAFLGASCFSQGAKDQNRPSPLLRHRRG